MPFLGARMHLGLTVPKSDLQQAKLAKLVDKINTHLQRNSLTSGDASSLYGALNHARAVQWGRYGAAACRPLQVRQRSPQHTALTASLRECLEWWQVMLTSQSGKAVNYDFDQMPY